MCMTLLSCRAKGNVYHGVVSKRAPNSLAVSVSWDLIAFKVEIDVQKTVLFFYRTAHTMKDK